MKVRIPGVRLRGSGAGDGAAVPVDVDQEVAPPIDTAAGVVKTTLTARVVSMLVGGCLLAGPAGLLVAVTAGGGGDPVVADTPTVVAAAPSDDAGRVGEFAVQVVVATLTGSRDLEPADWVPGDAGSGEQGLRVVDPSVVKATDVGQWVWSVVVAATVRSEDSPAVRRFYQVAAVVDPGGTIRAAGGVAQVGAPVYEAPADLGYPERVPDGPARDTVTGFLEALLTGSGEVDRYTAPGTSIRPVVPAPYVEVEVLDVAAATLVTDQVVEGSEVRVLASVIGRVSQAEQVPLSYALTLGVRAGRWEISRLDPAPAVRAPSSAPTSSSSSFSSPSPTSTTK